MNYCSHCGNELQESGAFCGNCGKPKLEKSAESASSGSSAQTVESASSGSAAGSASLGPSGLPAPASSAGKKKFWIIGGSVILIAAASVFVYMFLNNPVKKFEAAILDQNYTEASEIYNDGINGNLEKEQEAEDFIKTEIERIKQAFIDNKSTFEDASADLETIVKVEIMALEANAALNDVKELDRSRTAFKEGEELVQAKKYKEGLLQLKAVIIADRNYDKAQDLVKQASEDYKNEIAANAASLAKAQDFAGAINMLDEALNVVPGDAGVIEKKADYEKEHAILLEAERKKKMEEARTSQLATILSAGIAIQSDEFKALYPDMIQVKVKNNSDKKIKDIVVSMLGFDANGLPVRVRGQFDFSDGAIEFIGQGEDVNIVPQGTFGDDSGWSLDTDHGIKKVLACVKEVVFYDDTTWTNPYYEYWIGKYKEKPLESTI